MTVTEDEMYKLIEDYNERFPDREGDYDVDDPHFVRYAVRVSPAVIGRKITKKDLSGEVK